MDLCSVVPDDRRLPLVRQLRLLDEAVRARRPDGDPDAAWTVADATGIGAGDDVVEVAAVG